MLSTSQLIRYAAAIALLSCTHTRAQEVFSFLRPPQTQIVPDDDSLASLRLDSAPEVESENTQRPARLQRQIVRFPSHEAPGTIIVDTANTFLYYILGNGKAIRYGIGVGREGFTWSGVKTCRAWSQAAPAIRSARVRYTSEAPSIAFTAPMIRRALVSTFQAAASA